MPHLLQSASKNRLLAALSPADFDLLQPHLQSALLKIGDVLIQADTPITHICFVEQGIISFIMLSADSKESEIGLVGREGMIGVPILLDTDRTPNEARVQIAGWAWHLSANAFRSAIQSSPSLHATLLRYMHVVFSQAAGTALANGCYKLEQRLARWLLMYHDRIEGDVLAITHYYLSKVLGVTRTSLTPVIASFEHRSIVTAQRGKITIVDRIALLKLAEGAYGMPETEYERLIGNTNQVMPIKQPLIAE